MEKKKLLIVEDEIVAGLGLQDLIEMWGYGSCELAMTGEEAIEMSQSCLPDLILMDVNLPGDLNGIEAAVRIREERFVPVLFVSGYSDEEIRERVGDLNGADFINKPLDFELLKQKIKLLLSD